MWGDQKKNRWWGQNEVGGVRKERQKEVALGQKHFKSRGGQKEVWGGQKKAGGGQKKSRGGSKKKLGPFLFKGCRK